MATCFCKQPCKRHAFPMIRTKEQALKSAHETGLIKKRYNSWEEFWKKEFIGKDNGKSTLFRSC